MSAATAPRRKRRVIGDAEYRRFDAVLIAAEDNIEALRGLNPFWAIWCEDQIDRAGRYGAGIYLSERELEIVEEIAHALATFDVLLP